MIKSYYGGMPGYSFQIAKTYSSITDMNANINTDVHCGEYVLISPELNGTEQDYVNRNNPDNGKLYMRNHDNTAKYVGCISGPTGLAPFIGLENYDDVLVEYNNITDPARRFKVTNDTANFVPGYDPVTNTYNDGIDWVSVSIVSADGVNTQARLGFRIPYMTYEFEADLEGANYSGNYLEEVDANDGARHVFHHKYKLHIPTGPKGADATNLQVVSRSRLGNIDGAGNGLSSSEIAKIPSSYLGDDIIVYKETVRDIHDNPTEIWKYLGVVNTVHSMTTDAAGNISYIDKFGVASALGYKLDSIDSIRQITNQDVRTNPALENWFGHVLVRWKDASKNTQLIDGIYYEDLGVAESNAYNPYYGTITDSMISAGGYADIFDYLHGEYPGGISGVYAGAAFVYNKGIYICDYTTTDPIDGSHPWVWVGNVSSENVNVITLSQTVTSLNLQANGEYLVEFSLSGTGYKAAAAYNMDTYTDVSTSSIVQRSWDSTREILSLRFSVGKNSAGVPETLTTVKVVLTPTVNGYSGEGIMYTIEKNSWSSSKIGNNYITNKGNGDYELTFNLSSQPSYNPSTNYNTELHTCLPAVAITHREEARDPMTSDWIFTATIHVADDPAGTAFSTMTSTAEWANLILFQSQK